MLLPTTFLAGLILLVFTALCWGSWPNLYKRLGRWRFELFYYDFALGALIFPVLAAFTLGSWNSKELTFQDNLLITGYRNIAYAAGAGVVFNLGNMLLLGAISASGMAIVFPVAMGIALVLGSLLNLTGGPTHANLTFLTAGAALALVSVILSASAYGSYAKAQRAAARKAATLAGGSSTPTARPPRALKPVVLSIFGGIALGFASLVMSWAALTEPQLGAYGAAVFFGAGVLLSTLIYNPFFLNFPVQGKAVEFTAYFKGSGREHLFGWLSGAIFMAGVLSIFAAAGSRQSIEVEPATVFAASTGASIIGALWGLAGWRDFQNAAGSVKTRLILMFLCFAAGLALICLAK